METHAEVEDVDEDPTLNPVKNKVKQELRGFYEFSEVATLEYSYLWNFPMPLSNESTEPQQQDSLACEGGKRKRLDRDKHVLQTGQQQFGIGQDEAGLLGEQWSQKLRDLPRDQRRLVKKFVEKIFMEAELGTLQKNSLQIN